MQADLQDCHWSVRELLMEDADYLATQDIHVIEFYKQNGVKATYVEPRKAVLCRKLCHADD